MLEVIPTDPSQPHARRATPLARALWALLAAGAWSVLGTAAWLRPDGRGFGTHEQLGLSPCGFAAATGVPCPGCGLTTSFAQMAHGHALDALRAHLMGPPLFVLTALVALYAPFALYRARPLGTLLETRPAVPALALTAAAGIATFALRLAHVLPAQ
jgi:hypothetical protein